VATIAEVEVEEGVETLIAEYHDALRVRRRTYTRHVRRNAILIHAGEEGLRHLVASEISMSLAVTEVVVAEEVAVTDLASVVALPRAVVPLLHHLVAFDAHPLQVAHELHRGGESEDRHLLTAPDHHRLAVHDVPLPSIQCPRSHDGEGISHGPQAMIAEGYPGTCHARSPPRRRASRAHHRPECPDHVHGLQRVAAADLLAAHAVQSESADAGTRHLKPTHTAREPTSGNASVRLILVGHDRQVNLVERNARSRDHRQRLQPEHSNARKIRSVFERFLVPTKQMCIQSSLALPSQTQATYS
jgi:hypothetical protein